RRRCTFSGAFRARAVLSAPHDQEEDGLNRDEVQAVGVLGTRLCRVKPDPDTGVPTMPATRLRALRYALVVVGLICIVGLFPLTRIWPSGWRWEPDNDLYLQMIAGIYATLGVFLLLAARDPQRHLSLIWFTVWSSVVHGGIMAGQAIVYPMHRGHLL